jgi:hypothetical protein
LDLGVLVCKAYNDRQGFSCCFAVDDVDSDHLLQNMRKYGLDISFELWLSPVALCHISLQSLFTRHLLATRDRSQVTGVESKFEGVQETFQMRIYTTETRYPAKIDLCDVRYSYYQSISVTSETLRMLFNSSLLGL